MQRTLLATPCVWVGGHVALQLVAMRVLLSLLPPGFCDASFHAELCTSTRCCHHQIAYLCRTLRDACAVLMSCPPTLRVFFNLGSRHGVFRASAMFVLYELAFITCLYILIRRNPSCGSPPQAAIACNDTREAAPCSASCGNTLIQTETVRSVSKNLSVNTIPDAPTLISEHKDPPASVNVLSKYTEVCENKVKLLHSLVSASDDGPDGEWEIIVDRGDAVKVWKSRNRAHRYRLCGIFSTVRCLQVY